MQNRVFLIKGNPSSWFLEAFFVVPPNANIPKNLVLEAERIVSSYLFSHGLSDTKPETEQNVISSAPDTAKTIKKINKNTGYTSEAFLYIIISICIFLLGYVIRGVMLI